MQKIFLQWLGTSSVMLASLLSLSSRQSTPISPFFVLIARERSLAALVYILMCWKADEGKWGKATTLYKALKLISVESLLPHVKFRQIVDDDGSDLHVRVGSWARGECEGRLPSSELLGKQRAASGRLEVAWLPGCS